MCGKTCELRGTALLFEERNRARSESESHARGEVLGIHKTNSNNFNFHICDAWKDHIHKARGCACTSIPCAASSLPLSFSYPPMHTHTRPRSFPATTMTCPSRPCPRRASARSCARYKTSPGHWRRQRRTLQSGALLFCSHHTHTAHD